jgi:hypothetical protein
LTLIDTDDVDRGYIDELWDQGVNLDDWDYLIIAPVDQIEWVGDEPEPAWNNPLGRLLTGCCANRWYKVQWDGQEVALGVAYHG